VRLEGHQASTIEATGESAAEAVVSLGELIDNRFGEDE